MSSTPRGKRLLHVERLTLAQACGRSLLWVWPWTGLVFVLVLAGSFLWPAEASLRSSVWKALAWGVFAGAWLFFFRLLILSRPLLARVFAVAAFLATLFGLAMLVLFFWQLGRGVHHYLTVMPEKVEAANRQLVQRAAEARNFQGLLVREMREIDEEMAFELSRAASEEERNSIRADYERMKARKVEDLKKTAPELMTDAGSIREDTSPAALLGHFFTSGPSNQEQEAGILPALLGSLLVSLITILCAVPLGVGAAIYLEEYKSSGRLARFIQINISNLAGVPSVVYGILGAFVFVELIFKPLELHLGSARLSARNTLGGGLTLALLTQPVVIITAQEAIRAVPVSIRHAALALGATRWQVIRHHVLPMALPGILTGTILALSRAMGEAAPLVLFGALLYVDHNPTLLGRFTVLPMQIFNWTGRAGAEWKYDAALASVVLLVALLALNAAAIYVRYRLQRRVRH